MCGTNLTCVFATFGAHIAERYEVVDKVLHVDGKVFPWLVAEKGPRMESVGADELAHILWVPILVDSPMIPSCTEPPGAAHKDQGGWLTGGATLVENKTARPEPILNADDWERLSGTRDPMTAITVTTEANTPDAFTEAATKALTQSNGAPLKLEGIHQYVEPDKYKGGHKTGYAWTFTPLPD